VACDHYHMYKTDIALMKSMGLKHYRFSISWPRLIPTGKLKDGVNLKAKAFYNNLIDGLLEAGITPYVTLYHWDLPQGLLDPPGLQGWWSRDNTTGKPDGQILPDWLDYVKVCFGAFGDRVKTWVTFNEAWTFLWLGSGWGSAPSIPEFSNMTIDPFIAGHNVLLAHAYAVDLYRREFQSKQGGHIGITNNQDWREPKTTDVQDLAATERVVLFQLGWMSDPIFGESGDYPAEMRALYGSRLPEFTAEQKALLKGSADFFGLNHYGTGWAAYDPNDTGVAMTYAKITEEGFCKGQSSWLYGSGWGFRKLLNWVARRYNNPPLYVTESGWSMAAHGTEDAVSDHQRVMYYANYTEELWKAIHEDKLNIRGYFAWSLMDNFEWSGGYGYRFGTTYTDYDFGFDENAPANNDSQPTSGSQWRRRKDSSCWLEKVWTSNSLVSPLPSSFAGCVGSSVFDGTFKDKKDGCPRTIKVVTSTTAKIMGSDPKAKSASEDCSKSGDSGSCECDGKTDKEWELGVVRLSGGSIIIDLSDRGGASNFAGFWNDQKESIEWADGNSWQKVDGNAKK